MPQTPLPSDMITVPGFAYGCFYRGWALKNWCFWTVLLKKTLESPLDYKEIKPVNSKGNQPWIVIGRTDAEAPILWPPDAKSWLIWKDPESGKAWGQEEKGMTEDEMAGWHHQLNGHEFEQTLGDGEGQGSLVCCSSWGGKVRHDLITEQQFLHSPSHPICYACFYFLCIICCFLMSLSFKKKWLQSSGFI